MPKFEDFYKIIKAIPKGKVASYGQIAAMAGSPRAARMVGWALHQLDQIDPKNLRKLPWHRVINARGEISTTCQEHTAQMQAKLLRKDGVEVKLENGVYKIDLEKYRWLK